MPHFKRTRSQLALPDFDFHQLSRSPLKDAKSAQRKLSSSPHRSTRPSNDLHPENNSKRPSSPLPGTAFPDEPMRKRVRNETGKSDAWLKPPSNSQRDSGSIHPRPPSIAVRRSRSVPPIQQSSYLNLHGLPQRERMDHQQSFSVPHLSHARPLNPTESSSPVPTLSSTGAHKPRTPQGLKPPTLMPPMSPLTPLPVTPAVDRHVTTSSTRFESLIFPTTTNNHDVPHAHHELISTAPVKPQISAAPSSRLPRPVSSNKQDRDRPSTSRKANPSSSQFAAGVSSRITRSTSIRQREGTPGGGDQVSASVKGQFTAKRVENDSGPNSLLNSASFKRQATLLSFVRPPSDPVRRRRAATVEPATISAHATHPPKSSLSSLSSALQKLSMPMPQRSSTSMGFNHDANDNRKHEAIFSHKTTDDIPSGMSIKRNGPSTSTSPAISIPATPVRKSTSTNHLPPPSSTRQTTLMLPPPAPGSNGVPSRPGMVVGPAKGSVAAKNHLVARSGHDHARSYGRAFVGAFGARRLMGSSRVIQKASKPTSLPSVEGSPVKSALPYHARLDSGRLEASSNVGEWSGHASGSTQDPERGPSSSGIFAGEHGLDVSGERRESATLELQSRRWENLPGISPRRGMSIDPEPLQPHTPTTSSQYHIVPSTFHGKGKSTSSEAADSRVSSLNGKMHSAPGLMRRASSSGAIVSTRSLSLPPSTSNGCIDILSDCTIFIDVRTDDGDDASPFFTDMLSGMGAKILSRVGQTCTHIVYKNGLMSTLTRYRLLKEPRPFVVGVAWVVQCAERRSHVDETKYLIGLEGTNVAGTNKRRRSMLPKQLQSPDLGSPNDGSSSSNVAGTSSTPVQTAQESVGETSSTPVVANDNANDSPSGGALALLPLAEARRRRSVLSRV